MQILAVIIFQKDAYTKLNSRNDSILVQNALFLTTVEDHSGIDNATIVITRGSSLSTPEEGDIIIITVHYDGEDLVDSHHHHHHHQSSSDKNRVPLQKLSDNIADSHKDIYWQLTTPLLISDLSDSYCLIISASPRSKEWASINTDGYRHCVKTI